MNSSLSRILLENNVSLSQILRENRTPAGIARRIEAVRKSEYEALRASRQKVWDFLNEALANIAHQILAGETHPRVYIPTAMYELGLIADPELRSMMNSPCTTQWEWFVNQLDSLDLEYQCHSCEQKDYAMEYLVIQPKPEPVRIPADDQFDQHGGVEDFTPRRVRQSPYGTWKS